MDLKKAHMPWKEGNETMAEKAKRYAHTAKVYAIRLPIMLPLLLPAGQEPRGVPVAR